MYKEGWHPFLLHWFFLLVLCVTPVDVMNKATPPTAIQSMTAAAAAFHRWHTGNKLYLVQRNRRFIHQKQYLLKCMCENMNQIRSGPMCGRHVIRFGGAIQATNPECVEFTRKVGIPETCAKKCWSNYSF